MKQARRKRVILRSLVVLLSLCALSAAGRWVYMWQYAEEVKRVRYWCNEPLPQNCTNFDHSSVVLLTAALLVMVAIMLFAVLVIVSGIFSYIFGPEACSGVRCACPNHKRGVIATSTSVVTAAIATAAAVIAISNM